MTLNSNSGGMTYNCKGFLIFLLVMKFFFSHELTYVEKVHLLPHLCNSMLC